MNAIACTGLDMTLGMTAALDATAACFDAAEPGVCSATQSISASSEAACCASIAPTFPSRTEIFDRSVDDMTLEIENDSGLAILTSARRFSPTPVRLLAHVDGGVSHMPSSGTDDASCKMRCTSADIYDLFESFKRSRSGKVATPLFIALLEQNAWLEAAKALKHANSRFSGFAQRSMEKALCKFIKEHPETTVRGDVIAAAAGLRGISSRANIRHFASLLDRRDWVEADGVLKYARANFSGFTRRSMERVLHAFMEEHPEAARGTLFMDLVYPYSRHYDKDIRDLTHQLSNSSRSSSLDSWMWLFPDISGDEVNAAIVMALIDDLIKRDFKDELSMSSIADAVKLGLPMSGRVERFELLLERRLWISVKRILKNVQGFRDEKMAEDFQVCLGEYMRRSPDVEVPVDVIVAAYELGHRSEAVPIFVEELSRRGAWQRLGSLLKMGECGDGSVLFTLLEQLKSGKRVPAEMIDEAMEGDAFAGHDVALCEFMLARQEWDVVMRLLERGAAQDVAENIVSRPDGYRDFFVSEDVRAMAKTVLLRKAG